jgi:hypothetical protein
LAVISAAFDGSTHMATKGKTQLLITFVASPDQVTKIDALVARGCPEFRGTWVTARVLVRRPPESRARV